jgi:hypothetical protein
LNILDQSQKNYLFGFKIMQIETVLTQHHNLTKK